MLKSSRKSVTPIGIDFDLHEIRAVQFGADDSTNPIAVATMVREGNRSVNLGDDELKRLAMVLGQRGFVGNKIALAVPKESSSFHILDLPPEGSGAPIGRLALLEAQRSGAHKTDDLQIGFWTRPCEKVISPYYTIACETEPLDVLIDSFEAAHLHPVGIEPAETALARSLPWHDEFTQDAIHSVVEIGWDKSWAIITLGNIPVYTREIDSGTAKIRNQLIDDHAIPVHAIKTLFSEQHLSSSHDSQVVRILSSLLTPLLTEIVEQLDIALTYVSQQHRFAPFGVVFRSGYFSHLDQAAHAIAQRTGMPTVRLNGDGFASCLGGGFVSDFEMRCSPRLNIAAGLARGGAA